MEQALIEIETALSALEHHVNNPSSSKLAQRTFLFEKVRTRLINARDLIEQELAE